MFTIDLGCRGAVADIAVNSVSEIYRCSAARQRHDLAARREHVHRIWKQINLDVIPKFSGVTGFVLDVEQGL